MSEQAQATVLVTTYAAGIRPAGGGPIADTFQANVGQAFGLQAVILVYEDGVLVGEADPAAVQWTFGGASQYLSTYQPTVPAAAPDFDVDLQANPVQLFYWFPEVPGGTSTVPITCNAQAPDGTWVQADAALDLLANQYAFVGGDQGVIQLQPLGNGNTLLSYGDALGGGTPGFAIAFNLPAGAAYPGWLGTIQLVRSLREFTGQSGTVYPVRNTDGDYVLDASAQDVDYIYGKVQVEEGEIAGYTFDDSPSQELLPVIDDDPITQFDVNETFALFFVYNGSTTASPNTDAGQIWFPITAFILWNWQATVTNDGQNVWTIVSSQASGPVVQTVDVPEWQGTVRP